MKLQQSINLSRSKSPRSPRLAAIRSQKSLITEAQATYFQGRMLCAYKQLGKIEVIRQQIKRAGSEGSEASKRFGRRIDPPARSKSRPAFQLDIQLKRVAMAVATNCVNNYLLMDNNIGNLNAATDFCPLCGNLLELPTVSERVECNRCNYSCSVLEYEQHPIVTLINFDEDKKWIDHHMMHKSNITLQEEVDLSTKASIKQECPKCGHDTMSYWTVQMRSADEGSTVFYECLKCKFRYQQNN